MLVENSDYSKVAVGEHEKPPSEWGPTEFSLEEEGGIGLNHKPMLCGLSSSSSTDSSTLGNDYLC